MMDIAIIADKDTLIGFKLAGIKDAALFSPESIKQSLEKFKDAKILILTENVAKYVRENELDRLVKAVIIEVPDKKGSTGYTANEISRLFESSIGVKLKEKE